MKKCKLLILLAIFMMPCLLNAQQSDGVYES